MSTRTIAVLVAFVFIAAISYGIGRYLGWVPTRVGDLTYVSVEPFHGNDEDKVSHLIVKFRSEANLRWASAGAGLYASFSRCPFSDSLRIFVGRVAHNGIDLARVPTRTCESHNGGPMNCRTADDTSAIRAEVTALDGGGPFIYESYFNYRTECEVAEHEPCVREHPLPHPPLDVCVRVENFGPHFRSNVFRIPGKDIAIALAAR